MLSVNHLDIRFGEKHLFKDLSATIYPGDRIGLVGVNGTGKTSLMRIMAGETLVDDGVVNRARYVSVGYLPQETGVISASHSVYEEAERSFGSVLDLQRELDELHHQLAAVSPDSEESRQLLERQGDVQHRLEDHDVYTIRTRVEKVLHGLGFSDEDLGRPVASFSGGWVMRLLLARMLLAEPSLMLLDEPTNHLDLDSLTWLESFLQSYRGALVIISHDRAFLDRTTRQTWELSLGRLTVYKGNYSYYVRDKEERRRIEKSAYANQQAQIRQTMRFVERFKAKATKARQAQSRLRQLEKMDLIELAEDERQISFRFPAAPHSGRDVLLVESVSKRYGSSVVFKDVDLLLQRGDKVAVVGVNGAGKSTLLRIMADQIRPESGCCRLGSGVQLTYFGQHQAQELAPEYTVLETLSHSAADMTMTQMRSLLGAFLFRGEDVDKKVAVLSGGEKSRLALARMIAIPANCMLLDEPTNHLDMSSQEVLQEAMKQYDGTIVVVSHNRYFLDCFVNKVLEVKHGIVTLYEGNVADYLQRLQVLEQRLVQREPETNGDGATESEATADSRKKRRRRDAERRRKRQELAGPWLKKLAEAERRVEELEREKTDLEQTLADPELYQDQRRWSSTSATYEETVRRLDRWLTRWEEAQGKIDELDRRLAGDE